MAGACYGIPQKVLAAGSADTQPSHVTLSRHPNQVWDIWLVTRGWQPAGQETCSLLQPFHLSDSAGPLARSLALMTNLQRLELALLVPSGQPATALWRAAAALGGLRQLLLEETPLEWVTGQEMTRALANDAWPHLEVGFGARNEKLARATRSAMRCDLCRSHMPEVA